MAEAKAKKTPRRATAKVVSGKKDTTPKAAVRAGKTRPVPDAQKRYEMIEYAAYFIAERNDFIGDPLAFWAEAEAQINAT